MSRVFPYTVKYAGSNPYQSWADEPAESRAAVLELLGNEYEHWKEFVTDGRHYETPRELELGEKYCTAYLNAIRCLRYLAGDLPGPRDDGAPREGRPTTIHIDRTAPDIQPGDARASSGRGGRKRR